MPNTVTHEDGRVCRFLAYALETMPVREQLYAWFYGEPPHMRICRRAHPSELERASDG